MFCKNCGNELNSNQKFCNNCGALNDQFVETPASNAEDTANENTFMNTQPFSIDEVAQKVEEEKVPETVVGPAETVPAADSEPVEPKAVETPVAPNYSAPEATIAPVSNESTVVSTPKKKGNGGFIVIVIVLVALILGIGGFILYRVLGNNTDTPTVTPSNNNSDNTKNNSNNNNNNTNNNNNNTNNNTNESTTFTYGGYKFTVPSGFEKQEAGNEIIIKNSSKGYMIEPVYLSTSSYAEYKSQMDSLTEQLKSKAKESQYADQYTYLTTSEQTYSGKNFIVVAFSFGSAYMDYVFTELPDGKVIEYGIGYNYSDKADAYKAVVEINKSAVKDTSSTYDASKNNSSSFSTGVAEKLK